MSRVHFTKRQRTESLLRVLRHQHLAQWPPRWDRGSKPFRATRVAKLNICVCCSVHSTGKRERKHASQSVPHARGRWVIKKQVRQGSFFSGGAVRTAPDVQQIWVQGFFQQR